jgi:hypothetical protein
MEHRHGRRAAGTGAPPPITYYMPPHHSGQLCSRVEAKQTPAKATPNISITVRAAHESTARLCASKVPLAQRRTRSDTPNPTQHRSF